MYPYTFFCGDPSNPMLVPEIHLMNLDMSTPPGNSSMAMMQSMCLSGRYFWMVREPFIMSIWIMASTIFLTVATPGDFLLPDS